MFERLTEIARRPQPFECYTALDLWNDEYVSQQMLEFHLNENVEAASRKKEFVDRSVNWIASRFDIGEDTTLCDMGCGPGLYTTPFARLGAKVTGVDFSENSIRYAMETAKNEGLQIDYVLKNYLEFSSDKQFDLITMIYVDFCPLSPTQRKTHLQNIHRSLKDDGAFFLDVLTLNHFEATEGKSTYEYNKDGGFWSSDPHHVFLNTFKYETEKLILDKYDIFEKDRTRTIYNWLQCFNPESIQNEFEENGFRIVERYADVAGAPYRNDATQTALVAVKQ